MTVVSLPTTSSPIADSTSPKQAVHDGSPKAKSRDNAFARRLEGEQKAQESSPEETSKSQPRVSARAERKGQRARDEDADIQSSTDVAVPPEDAHTAAGPPPDMPSPPVLQQPSPIPSAPLPATTTSSTPASGSPATSIASPAAKPLNGAPLDTPVDATNPQVRATKALAVDFDRLGLKPVDPTTPATNVMPLQSTSDVAPTNSETSVTPQAPTPQLPTEVAGTTNPQPVLSPLKQDSAPIATASLKGPTTARSEDTPPAVDGANTAPRLGSFRVERVEVSSAPTSDNAATPKASTLTSPAIAPLAPQNAEPKGSALADLATTRSDLTETASKGVAIRVDTGGVGQRSRSGTDRSFDDSLGSSSSEATFDPTNTLGLGAQTNANASQPTPLGAPSLKAGDTISVGELADRQPTVAPAVNPLTQLDSKLRADVIHPELGRISVETEMQKGQLNVVLRADLRQTMHRLNEEAPKLTANLAQNDIAVGTIAVKESQQGSSSHFQDNQHRDNRESGARETPMGNPSHGGSSFGGSSSRSGERHSDSNGDFVNADTSVPTPIAAQKSADRGRVRIVL